MGVPLIVKVFPASTPFTPAGRPVTVAPVAPPPIVYTIFPIALLTQTVWAVVDDAEVRVNVELACTVIEPVTEGFTQGPAVITE